jgi:CBS-domain-containing membrane protein
MSATAMYIGGRQTLGVAAQTMERYGIGALPVIGTAGELWGIVSRADLRDAGVLPNQPGVDRCMTCGAGHRLMPRDTGQVCFCRDCVERARSATRDAYVVLGTGD